jgi:hypothetical protein
MFEEVYYPLMVTDSADLSKDNSKAYGSVSTVHVSLVITTTKHS